MSRLLTMFSAIAILILCVALPSITFADTGDDPTPIPDTETGTGELPQLDGVALQRMPTTSGASLAIAAQGQIGSAVLPYRASLPLVLGGSGATGASAPSFESEVLQLVNQQRSQAGCAPFQLVPELNSVAQEHSADMATNDFFAHTGSDGSGPWDRMDRVGYAWTTAAENIAASASTPADVVAVWMNSPGHRANMLDCSLRDTGIGYVYLTDDSGQVNYHSYWTQVFGSR